jgi:hypothetical protein
LKEVFQALHKSMIQRGSCPLHWRWRIHWIRELEMVTTLSEETYKLSSRLFKSQVGEMRQKSLCNFWNPSFFAPTPGQCVWQEVRCLFHAILLGPLTHQMLGETPFLLVWHFFSLNGRQCHLIPGNFRVKYRNNEISQAQNILLL